jgi:hypothetical protein
MSFSYKNRTLLDLAKSLEGLEAEIRREAFLAVKDVVEEAVDTMRKVLAAATTKTGAARYKAGIGRGPGRNLTGLMMDSTDSAVGWVSGNEIVGQFGWPNPEDYFLEQDWGMGKIPAAHSLLTAFTLARVELDRRIHDIANGLVS